MKALAVSLIAGAALCSALAVPASAMPAANLAAAASDLALDQSVRSGRNYHRYRSRGYSGYAPGYYGYYGYAPGYYGYGAGYPGYAQNCYGYGSGPNSPCYP
jgi:hypothetical protein